MELSSFVLARGSNCPHREKVHLQAIFCSRLSARSSPPAALRGIRGTAFRRGTPTPTAAQPGGKKRRRSGPAAPGAAATAEEEKAGEEEEEEEDDELLLGLAADASAGAPAAEPSAADKELAGT